MRISDSKHVLNLSQQLGYTLSPVEFLDRFAQIQDRTDQDLWVAIDSADESAVGWIHLGTRLSLINPLATEVVALVVDEKYRGKGIGKLLMNLAISQAKEKKHPIIFLRSNIIRKEAHQFYVKLGFEQHKASYKFTLPL